MFKRATAACWPTGCPGSARLKRENSPFRTVATNVNMVDLSDWAGTRALHEEFYMRRAAVTVLYHLADSATMFEASLNAGYFCSVEA